MDRPFWVTVTGWTGSGDAPGSIVTTPLGPAALTAATSSCRWVLSDCWLRGTTKTLAGASRVSNPSRHSRTRLRGRGIEGDCRWVERYRCRSQCMAVLHCALPHEGSDSTSGGVATCSCNTVRKASAEHPTESAFFP